MLGQRVNFSRRNQIPKIHHTDTAPAPARQADVHGFGSSIHVALSMVYLLTSFPVHRPAGQPDRDNGQPPDRGEPASSQQLAQKKKEETTRRWKRLLLLQGCRPPRYANKSTSDKNHVAINFICWRVPNLTLSMWWFTNDAICIPLM